MTTSLNHLDSEVRERITGAGKIKRERFYAVPCPVCQETRWLRAYDARKVIDSNAPCLPCANRVKGKLGWAAVSGRPKYRRRKWLGLQQYLNDHPSNLEQRIAETLEAQGWRFDTNELVETSTGTFYLVDFVVWISGVRHAIEVDGEYWHKQPHQIERDRNKRALLKRRGYRVLVIPEAQVAQGDHPQAITQFLQ